MSRSSKARTRSAPSSADFGINWSPSSAISSLDRGPARTRTGGRLGLCVFASELSYVYRIVNLVPRGSGIGVA